MRTMSLLLFALAYMSSAFMAPQVVHAQPSASYEERSSAGGIIIVPAAMDVRRARIAIDPTRGRPGTEIRVRAAGFRPYRTVRVLIGRDPYSLKTHGRARADDSGRVRTRVQVPEWARPGATYFVALESTNGRIRAISEPFRVTRRIDDDRDERIDEQAYFAMVRNARSFELTMAMFTRSSAIFRTSAPATM